MMYLQGTRLAPQWASTVWSVDHTYAYVQGSLGFGGLLTGFSMMLWQGRVGGGLSDLVYSLDLQPSFISLPSYLVI